MTNDDEREVDVIEAHVTEQEMGPNETPARQGIKVAELGRRPKLVNLNPGEEGRSVAQLINEGLIKASMEYFVNGQRVDEASLVLPGDALVAVPRIRGG